MHATQSDMPPLSTLVVPLALLTLCFLTSSHASSSSSSSNTTEELRDESLVDNDFNLTEKVHQLPGYCMGRGIWRLPPRASLSHSSSSSELPSLAALQKPNPIVLDNTPSHKSCPYVQVNHRCSSRHEQDTVGRLVYQAPDHCPIHSLESLRIGQPGSCLSGKQIAFVGDSLVRQLVTSLACGYGNSSTINFTLHEKYGTRWKRIEFVFENGMNMTFHYIGNMDEQLPLHRSAKPSIIWKYTDPTADVLVLNLAIYHTDRLSRKHPHSPASLRAKILSYGPEIRQHAKGRVVIMGAPAQHVSGCAKPPDTLHANPILARVAAATNAEAGATASPITNELIRRQNEYLAELAALNGFDFVNVFPLTVHRPDAHVSTDDCVHYCSRGAHVSPRPLARGGGGGGMRVLTLSCQVFVCAVWNHR